MKIELISTFCYWKKDSHIHITMNSKKIKEIVVVRFLSLLQILFCLYILTAFFVFFQTPVANALESDAPISGSKKSFDLSQEYEIVENYSSLYDSTKDNVIVLNNDSFYGDGGFCIFKKMDATRNGYLRADGTRVFPEPNQGVLQNSTASYNEIMCVVKSYCGNDALQYGYSGTLFNDLCVNRIDCSSFVNAVLYDISYEHSRYVGVSNELGSFRAKMPNAARVTNDNNRLLSMQLAQYFAEQKTLFSFDSVDPTSTIEQLRTGDILFFSYTDEEMSNSSCYYYNIRHAAVVLGTIPEENYIVIAECGEVPKPLSVMSNEESPVKTTVLKVSNDQIHRICMFARPIYSAESCTQEQQITHYDLKSGTLVFDTHFQLNSAIDLTDGHILFSMSTACTKEYYPVFCNAKLIYEGDYIVDDEVFCHYVAEYDGNYRFIQMNQWKEHLILNSATRFIRFMCGFEESADTAITLDTIDHFYAYLAADCYS